MENQKKEEIDLLKETPEQHIMGKLNEVLAACVTLKSRIDIIEDHVVFLLSKSQDYLKLMETQRNEEQNKQV